MDKGGPLDEKLMALALATADGFRALSQAAEGGSVADVGGAMCWYSSSFVPTFNGAGLFSEKLLNRDTLSAIENYFGASGEPYSLLTIDGLVAGAYEWLVDHDFVELNSSPAMWLDLPEERWQQSPPALTIRQVATEADLVAFRHVLNRVFAIPPAELELIMSDRALQVPDVRHYVAWAGEQAVGSTSLVLSTQAAGIWNVGTMYDYRRQGIGVEMMHHALAEAAGLGYQSSMLLASAQGLPLYERLGYKTISTARMFTQYRGSRY